jgi:hypothetical protein
LTYILKNPFSIVCKKVSRTFMTYITHDLSQY